MKILRTFVLNLPRGFRVVARALLPPVVTGFIVRFLREEGLGLPFQRKRKWQILEAKLWSGFAQRALQDLEQLKGDPTASPEETSGAARALAGWYASFGDWRSAYENALITRFAYPRSSRSEMQVVLEADALLELGRPNVARQVLEQAIQRWPLPGAYQLAMANTYAAPPGASSRADDKTRLKWINSLFQETGLAPLGKIDERAPLTLQNLTALTDGRFIEISESPKVSVLIPAFKAEDTLPFALDSLLAQTWKNLEIVVVDDVSPDGTYEVAAEYARRDSRVIALRQTENLGAYAARNVGLQHATGEFVTVHDADDWSHPQKIAVQVQELLSHPEIPANVTDWVRCTSQVRFRPRARAILSWIHFNHSSLMLRRELLLQMGGWDEVRIAADSELIRRLEKNWAAPISRVHRGVPLSFALVAETSLTQHRLTHARTLRHGVRRTYFEASVHWIDSHEDTVPPLNSRPRRAFPAPPFILSTPGPHHQLQRLFVQDFSRQDSAFSRTLEDIDRALSKGEAVGVFHWPHYDSDVTKPLPADLLDRAQVNGLIVVTPGERLRADIVLCRHPSALTEEIDLVPHIDCVRVALSRHDVPPEHESATIAAAKRHFRAAPEWIETPETNEAAS